MNASDSLENIAAQKNLHTEAFKLKQFDKNKFN
ncbi:MAG: hypothetical protein N4J56_004277 [Chroococcidiopsis sp. SAG 2025]|nr:hypothetical protein [Chroococcidiopsis sp. SAG 2025]